MLQGLYRANSTSLSASGMSSEALSVCLELTADALSSRSPLEDLVDLVTTGPETGGVANRSTAVVVSELFRGAEHSVLVAGYAVYQGQQCVSSSWEPHGTASRA